MSKTIIDVKHFEFRWSRITRNCCNGVTFFPNWFSPIVHCHTLYHLQCIHVVLEFLNNILPLNVGKPWKNLDTLAYQRGLQEFFWRNLYHIRVIDVFSDMAHFRTSQRNGIKITFNTTIFVFFPTVN